MAKRTYGRDREIVRELIDELMEISEGQANRNWKAGTSGPPLIDIWFDPEKAELKESLLNTLMRRKEGRAFSTGREASRLVGSTTTPDRADRFLGMARSRIDTGREQMRASRGRGLPNRMLPWWEQVKLDEMTKDPLDNLNINADLPLLFQDDDTPPLLKDMSTQGTQSWHQGRIDSGRAKKNRAQEDMRHWMRKLKEEGTSRRKRKEILRRIAKLTRTWTPMTALAALPLLLLSMSEDDGRTSA